MPLSSKGATASETAQKRTAATREAELLGGDGLSIAARASVAQPRLVAVAALMGVLAISGVSYWWTKAPLYNPPGTIDPWLYTGLFINFDYIYEHFGHTYYASRLPWVVPGRLVYGVLPLDAAYWVLHGLAFITGVVCLFALVRRYAGVAPAVVGAGTLAFSPMYWNAQYWDYVDGAAIAYLAAGLYFGLPLSSGRRRAASMLVAGVFLAAAVTTNLLVGVFVLIYPIAYAFLQPEKGLRRRISLAVKDALALGVGAADLIAVLGLYAKFNGGSFLFFDAQIDFVRSGEVGSAKLSDYSWLRGEPRVLVPLFLVGVAIPLLFAGRRLPTIRFAAASVSGLAFLTTGVYLWEFAGGGAALDYSYSFSYFAVSIALAMAGIGALAMSLARSWRWARPGAALTATLAGVIALGLIYHGERAEWTGRTGFRISVVLIVVAVVLAGALMVTPQGLVRGVAAVLAVGAVAFAAHFAINSSSSTLIWSGTNSGNREVYFAGRDLVNHMNRSISRDTLPLFWYSGTRQEFIALHSLYYFGYTTLGFQLPQVTQGVKEMLNLTHPSTIVMLCETRDCGGGQAALRRSGYSYAEQSATFIRRGPVRFWAVLLQAA